MCIYIYICCVYIYICTSIKSWSSASLSDPRFWTNKIMADPAPTKEGKVGVECLDESRIGERGELGALAI